MFLIFLGLILGFVFITLSKTNPNLAKLAPIGKYVGGAMVALGILVSCTEQIGSGQVGVKTLFGKVQSDVLTEGLNFVSPLVDVVHFDSRTQNYTMSSIHDEGEKMGDDGIRVLSSDGLEVTFDLTVLYRIDGSKAPEILQTIGREYADKIVRPVTRTKIRDFASYYDAVSLYSTKREEFQNKLAEGVTKEFALRGFILENILVRNVTLPASVKQAIENKINAEQESQKMRFVLDKEKQEADRKRVEAQGIADYQRILTASLSDKLLQYEQIKAQKELATSSNAKVIVMGAGKNSPIIIGQ